MDDEKEKEENKNIFHRTGAKMQFLNWIAYAVLFISSLIAIIK